MKIEKTFWFSTELAGCLGAVLGTDEVTGEHKGYIGIGFGGDEEKDRQIIAERGQRLSPPVMKEISDYLNSTKKK